MLVDHIIASLRSSAGGPTRTVIQLSQALASNPENKIRLVTQAITEREIVEPSTKLVEMRCAISANALSHRFALSGRRALSRAIYDRRPDVLHSHGIWEPLNHWCAVAARRYEIPLVVQPRGMLEPWALTWHSTKKKLALSLYQQRDLKSASLLVATAESEALHFRQFGLRQPIAVIPNGVDLRVNGIFSEHQPSRSRGAKNALFLSRVHPKKGLENLLRVWAKIDMKGWVLQIAGPGENGYLQKILSLADQLGIQDQVHYLGEIDDVSKWALYRNADLFVLPSFSENFGVVVAEALSQAVPVITTTGTPWHDLRAYGCGWWVEPSEAGLYEALTEAFSLPPEHLSSMGRKGKNYVKRYNWPVIAEQMSEVYRWVLGHDHGRQPTCIHLD